jgi:hypothetical protein
MDRSSPTGAPARVFEICSGSLRITAGTMRLTTSEGLQTSWSTADQLAFRTARSRRLVRRLGPARGWRQPQAVVKTMAAETSPAFSGDGRWSPSSTESRRARSTCDRSLTGPTTQVSTDGGYSPVWSKTARAFYWLGDAMMAVTIDRARPHLRSPRTLSRVFTPRIQVGPAMPSRRMGAS